MNKDKILDYARDAFIDTINFLKIEATIEDLGCQTEEGTEKMRIFFKGKITNPPLDEPFATFSWSVLTALEQETIMMAVRRRMISVIALQVMREAPFLYAAIEAFRYHNTKPLAGFALMELDSIILNKLEIEKSAPTTKRLFEMLVSALREEILDPLDDLRNVRIEATKVLRN